MTPFEVPVLFIIFNRPDTTEKVFRVIREIKPSRFFVAADGPRQGREGEKEKCEAVRKIIQDGVDWDCDLQLKYSDFNMGCGRAESEAMTWFFRSVGEGIVLEDDTFPDLSFFWFCKNLLEKYRNDGSVKMIGGNNFQDGIKRGSGSYYFSGYTHSWGYASWWRAWQDYDFTLDSIDDDAFEKLLQKKFRRNVKKNFWKTVYNNFRAGKYDTWDFQFLFKMWQQDGKCIIPNKNLVSNIGFGNNATHTSNADDMLANLPLGKINNIIHPRSNSISYRADRYFFEKYLIREMGIISKLENIFRVSI